MAFFMWSKNQTVKEHIKGLIIKRNKMAVHKWQSTNLTAL